MKKSKIGYAEKHPGGFVCIELVSLENGDSLSLHYWDRPYLESIVHNHEFNGYSLILFGNIVNTTYEVNESSDCGITKFCYKTNYVNGKRNYSYSYDVKIKKNKSTLYTKNESYHIESNEFHHVEARGESSSTLFIRKDRNKLNGSNIITNKEFDSEVVENVYFEKEIYNLFETILDEMKNNDACKEKE